MSISLKTHKMLWGRAANRCGFPDCRRELIMPPSETEDASLIGDECHLVAEKPDGPRGESSLTPEERDQYNNLVLMCKIHHKLIDDQPETYPVQLLKEMKAAHEKWVRETLKDFNPAKQRDDEFYAECIERWVKDVDLDNWMDWTSRWIFMSHRPAISYKQLDTFEELDYWLLSRIWPKRYLELEAAFENFRRILLDLVSVHYRHSTADEETVYSVTDKSYHWSYGSDHQRLNSEEEQRQEYNLHHELLGDLMLELTRAANYICDKIRQFIDPTFRRRVGAAIVAFNSGDFYRPEYQNNERVLYPYPGLEQFNEVRKTRDLTF